MIDVEWVAWHGIADLFWDLHDYNQCAKSVLQYLTPWVQILERILGQS